jgi:hypothetical protein
MPDEKQMPVVNEMDHHDPIPTEDDTTPEKKGLSKKQMAGMAMAGIALAAIAAGVAFNANNRTKPEVIVYPKQAPAAETTTATTPENKVDSYITVMEKYANMDIETFEKLPRDERLQYAQYLIDQKVGDYGTYYGVTNKNAITLEPISVDNSGQEIIDSNLYNLQLSFMQDSLIEGEKAMSSVFYNVETGHAVTDAYDKYKVTLADAPVGLEYTRKAENTGNIMTGADGVGGDQRQYKVVSYYDSTNSETSYARFIYYEFTSYDGSEKSAWLMDGQATNSTELYSLGTVH